jgi:hypothetical protein
MLTTAYHFVARPAGVQAGGTPHWGAGKGCKQAPRCGAGGAGKGTGRCYFLKSTLRSFKQRIVCPLNFPNAPTTYFSDLESKNY